MVSRLQWMGRSALVGRPPDYEIQLCKADGSLSVVMVTSAVSIADAKAQARVMLEEGLGLTTAHIWRDCKLIDSIDAYN
jgi:hypothetical protein